ncbi:MAG: 6-phospho-beta-glucosidase [Firmicutes bacterium]|nr:6-phospho-beta-glucosidase [Bacillota bacterium]
MPSNGHKQLKIAVIGGGSTYTPELIEGFLARRDELPVGEVWLMDLPEAEEKLRIVAGLAERMSARCGRPFAVIQTTDRRAALDGADFVITQMRVGQLAARIRDERIPLSHGVIGQETTGPGGFANALRTIPVVLAICRDLAELAPEAWLINFANPSGLVTEAVTRYTKVKVVGLCNVPLNMQAGLAKAFGVDPAEIYVEFVGCNHLVWANRVFCRGVEVTERAIELTAEDPALNMKNIPHRTWSRDFLLSLGAIPCGYHRYYYLTKEILAELLEAEAAGRPTRGEVVREVEAELLRLYQDPGLDHKPEALAKRGGALYSEAAVRLISSLHHDRRDIQCVDTTNRGALADLLPEAVVEVNCVITAQGPQPIAVGHLRPQLRGLLQQVKAYEELTVEAAVTGDRGLALQALAAHPLVPSISVARALLADLLGANRDFLPQFKI